MPGQAARALLALIAASAALDAAHADPVAGVRTLSFSVADSLGVGDPSPRRIQVVPVNSAPIVAFGAGRNSNAVWRPVSAKYWLASFRCRAARRRRIKTIATVGGIMAMIPAGTLHIADC